MGARLPGASFDTPEFCLEVPDVLPQRVHAGNNFFLSGEIFAVLAEIVIHVGARGFGGIQRNGELRETLVEIVHDRDVRDTRCEPREVPLQEFAVP